jgi:GT2 family glycosyltransferase
MSKVAIIIGTYNRAELLRRSLHAYSKHDGLHLMIMDDGSTDNTLDVVKEFEHSNLNIEYCNLGEKKEYRDSASFLNIGIKYALHEIGANYIFITHPEIIVGSTTIESAVNAAANKKTWVSCKGYYLTAEQQKQIETIDIGSNTLNIHKFLDFYSAPSAEFTGDPYYLPANIEKAKVWQSWIFGGGSRAMWQYFGGLTEFKTWGSVDVDLLMRRKAAKMRTVTPGKNTDYVVHQNHDAPRDMQKCLQAVRSYSCKEEALKPNLLKK